MGFLVHKGITGKALCQDCRKPILKDEIAVEYYGYQISKQVHMECLKKEEIKIRGN